VNKCLVALLAIFIFAVPPGPPPKASISNGLITAQLYLPNAVNGYYRGTRFDWAGQIPDLRYKGHSYFGQWFEKYDPMSHDAIMGPVEAFDPVGYDEASALAPFKNPKKKVTFLPTPIRWSTAVTGKFPNRRAW